MSQNNTTILYAGLDVAKSSLQLHLDDRFHLLANDPKGHAKLLKLLHPYPQAQIVSIEEKASARVERSLPVLPSAFVKTERLRHVQEYDLDGPARVGREFQASRILFTDKRGGRRRWRWWPQLEQRNNL